MVAIVTGPGLGIERSSGFVLGSRGQLGTSAFGRYGENVSVNAANGNLSIDRTDEILIGQGPDNVISRNYNSLSPATGSTDDNNDNWRLSAQRQVVNLTGTYGAAGSTITRIDWDGSDTLYTWDSTRSAYACKQGAGAYDTLTMASNVWTWTDGNSRTVETYDNLNNGRITTSADTDGNTLVFAYAGSLLSTVTTTDVTSGKSEVTTLVYTGNNVTRIATQYYSSATNYTNGTSSTLNEVYYTYDAQNRLSTVTTDLSPTNNSIADGNTVVTTYTYDGTSNRVASISQTGGALLTIAYDGSNRVQTLAQTIDGTHTSTTTFAYFSGYTTITDANSQVTTLHFDTNSQLTQIDLPAAQTGATPQHLYYTYNSNGDVLTVKDGSGNVTTYTYDGNGNVLSSQDQAGNTVTNTYDSTTNALLNSTEYLVAATTGNQPPVAHNENLVVSTVGDSVTFDPRLESTDPENDTLTITAVSAPGHGTATVNSGASITYTRTSAGADSFTYTISDGHSHTATATVTIADTPNTVDLAPRAYDDNFTLDTAGTIIIDPRINDTDPEGDPLTITAVSTPANGTATIVNNGTAIQYSRDNTRDDSFTYTISDGHGHTSTGFISITHATANQAPVTNPDHIYLPSGGYLYFDPRANDYDPDGDQLTITGITNNTTGGVPIVTPDGTEILLAMFGGTGSKYPSLDYTVSDGHGHTATNTVQVTFTSTSHNVAPVAHNDGITLEGNGNSFTFDPRINDGDLDTDPLTITAVSSASHGTATIVGGTQIQYTRSSAGTDSFTYTISDGQGHTATATVTVSDPSLTNVAPTAVNDAIVVNGVGDSITFNPRVNDMDPDSDSLSITAVSTPSHGTATIVGNTIKYTRTSAGADSFTYTISDGHSHTSTATVNVTGTVSAGGTAPSQVLTTRYAYDSENHLRFAVSAAGEVTEYDYNAAGQQTSSIIYRGNVYNLTGLGPTDTLSESTLSAWASGLSDKSTVERVDTVYDFRGNISTVTTYSACSTAGAGLTTQPYTVVTYVYDQFGNLLSRRTSGISRSEVFAYDGLGRLISSTDLNNSATTIAYTDGTNTTTVTLSNGLVKTSTYNDAGELISSQQSGSGVPTETTSYAYDKLGQLRMVTDPLGNETYYLYDNVGRKIADIAADGSMTEYAYDAGDRLTTTISYLNKLTTTQLNSLVDVNGDPANVTLASVRPTTNAADIWTWRIYDTANRLIETINGDGDAVVYAYDGGSNLISTVAYANALSSVSGFKTTAPTTLQLPTADASRDEVTRNFYDADDRLIATLNGAGYLSEVVYDPAGEKTETIGFANQVDPSLRAGGTLAQLLANVGTSSGDRHVRYFYDDRGLLGYTLDATLVPTEYDYDNAGNLTGTIAYAGSINSTSTYTMSYVQSQITSTGLSTNANNRKSWAIYDTASGLLDFSIDANGGVTQFAYDSMGRVVKEIAYATTRTTTSLPSLSTMNSWASTHGSDAGNRISRKVYDQAGELVYTVDPLGYVTEYRYDNDKRVYLEIRYPDQYTVTDSVTQASLAAQIGSIPADAEQTSYTYTSDGQLASVTQGYTSAEAATTSYTYDGRGNRVTTTDPNGNVSYAFYDAAGRANLQIDAGGYATATTYTATGAIASVTHYWTAITGTINPASPPTPTTNANDATTTFTYDQLDRVVKVTDAEGNYEQYVLDAFGDRVSVQNKLGGITTNVFDTRGLLTSEVLPMVSTKADGTVESTSVTNTYAYNAFGDRTQMVEASGLTEQRTTTYVYDKLGRLTETDHDTVSTIADDLKTTSNITPKELVVYDAFGNVIESTDAASAHTFFYYDGLGRKTAQVDAVGTLSAFTYDANGNILTQTVYGDAVTLPGSPGGNPPSPVDPNNYRQTSYTYDHLNRLLTTTVASVQTGYYNTSTSAYVVPAVADITLTNYYDKNGNIICQTDGNGNHVWFYYDKNNHKVAEVDQELYLTTYTLDSNGNVLAEKRFATKLTSAPGVPPTSTPPTGTSDANNDRITNFTYDRNGNRLTEQRTGVLAWTVNTSNGALTASSTSATITYTYNGLGEVTSKTEATGDTTTYVYDANGRQLSVKGEAFTDYAGHTVQEGTSETYDGLNNLTRSVQNGDSYGENTDRVTSYTYGAGGRLSSTTDATGFVENYAYDADGRTKKISYSRLKSDGTSVTDAQATRYDALGRAVFQSVANFDGTNWNFGDQSQMQYDTYGEVTARGLNSMWQETNSYDNAGHLWRSTADDGTVKLYIYDGNGKQTLEIESDGNALPTGYDWSTITLTQAINLLTNNGTAAIGTVAVSGMVVTMTAYDKRGLATKSIAPLRQISQVYTPSTNTFGAYTTATITTSQTYNAFGEVASQTDARNNVTSYTYNTEGKVITTTHPAVNYTDESGTLHSSVTPIERAYYDLSGRLVGTRDAERDSGSYDATGLINTRVLLTNSGYGGSDPLTVTEFHADTGMVTNGYDVYGELRKKTDALNSVEVMTYDAKGRILTDLHPVLVGMPFVENYAYDGLGQRIKHWNSELGSSTVETTDYDDEGRVTQMTDLGGDQTTYSYAWSSTLATTGLGTFGGWTKTTTSPAMINSTTHYSSTDKTDYFGREIGKTDLGSHTYSYTFDLAGRLKTQTLGSTTDTYNYYNTGLTSSQQRGSTMTAAYQYDVQGNRTVEVYAINGLTYENETVTYDAMNRMISLSDPGAGGTAAYASVSMSWKYDRDSNIRNMTSSYQLLDAQGNVSGSSSENYWYKYDSMNRFVVTMGTLSGGVISAGTTGQAITYDLAGNRATSTDSSSGTTTYTYVPRTGMISTVKIGGTLRAAYTYDDMGRLTDYKEYDTDGHTVKYERQSTYNNKSELTQDIITEVRTDGTWVSTTSYGYNDASGVYKGGVVVSQTTTTTKNGVSQPTSSLANTFYWWAGAVTNVATFTPDTSHPATVNTSTYSYDTLGNLTSVAIVDGRPRTVSFVNTMDGKVLQRDEADNNLNTGDPRELHYYFNGIAVGDVSNNGTSNIDYAASIAEHLVIPGTGPFRDGSSTSTSYADFDQSYDPINGLNYQSTATRYTVQTGDTLESIAYALWGDASYWYLIADANGLNGSETLVAGQDLIIPDKIHNVHNNASTYRVYDPNEAMGDTSPTAPKKPKHHSHGCGLAQIFIAVIAVAVSIVTAGAALAAMGIAGISTVGAGVGSFLGLAGATSITFGEAVVAGAIGGAIGSVVSQGVGMAMGVQSQFSWSGVALGAIGGAISGGLGQAGLFSSVSGDLVKAGTSQFVGDFVQGAASGVAGSILTQGIGVATGLQKRFDWAGVAAAGIGGGISAAVGGAIGGTKFSSDPILDYGAHTFISGMAGAIANAGTRTLINGTDFGDNILAALPDTIAQTIGNMIAGGVSGSSDTQTASTGNPITDELDAEFARAQASDTGLSGYAQFAGPGAAASADQGFFGWLGDEISSGLNWVGNEIGAGFQAIGQALGIAPADDAAPTGIETVTVTADRIPNDGILPLDQFSFAGGVGRNDLVVPAAGPYIPAINIGVVFPNGVQPVNSRLAAAQQLLGDSRVQALLATIRDGESGNRYNLITGGSTFSDYSDHPNVYNPATNSTAAGAYQFTHGTWTDEVARLNLPDFSPASQDLAAVDLLQRLGAINDLQSGDLDSAIFAAARRWDSLPLSSQGASLSGGVRHLNAIETDYYGHLPQ